MSSWGLNTYVYALKGDLKLRAAWRDLYNEAELESLQALSVRCTEKGLAFVYTLSLGLSICYASEHNLRVLKRLESNAQPFFVQF